MSNGQKPIDRHGQKPFMFYMDEDIRQKIERLANFNRRRVAEQLRWMIDRDFERCFGKEPEPVKVEVPEEMPF